MKKIWRFMSGKQHTMGSAAIILMIMVVVSGLLGLVRYRVLNARFLPEETGIFLAAFRLPNLLFEMLAMGALTSAFIPVFTKFITNNKEDEAYKIAATVMNLTIIFLVILTIPIFIWAEAVSKMLTPGFAPNQVQEMATFTRFMIVVQVVPLIIGSFFTGILQSYQMFLIPALAPIVYNLGMILGVLIFSPMFGLTSAVIGVGIGALLYMLIQIPPIIRIGYRHRFSIDTKRPGVNEIGKMIFPRMIGLGASQIDTTIDLIMASLLGSKMVTVFFLAQSLQQLPVRLFGMTISQAALPSLSAATAKEDKSQFIESVMSAYHMILFCVLPVSVLFIVLRISIVRLVFGASRFDWEATVMTAMTLSAFSISLPAQAVVQVFSRGFYALYDSKTPVIISIFSIVINSILSVLFISLFQLPVWYLGLSTSVASIINAGVLIYILNKKVGGFGLKNLLLEPIRMLVASLVSGIIVFVPMKLMDQLVVDTTRVFGLIVLTGITGTLGCLCYLFLAWVFDVGQVQSLIKFIHKIKNVRNLFLESTGDMTGENIEN
jgi:putative peptidoglycan lipid II flippase